MLDPNREQESLKYGFYLFSGDPNNLFPQYPLMKRLRDADSPELRARLREGMIQMFRHLRNKIEENPVVRRRGWVVGKLSITIPNQWTLEFEEVYTQLLAEAFEWEIEVARRKIFFYTETEALGQLLLQSEDFEEASVALASQNKHKVCLVLDFGGHNLVRASDSVTPYWA